ncbi:MAG: hypothetical protein HQ479_14265 [Rhodobacter sp.]|jgi:hypothetical protein|nr:hypothetical protein [Rhodobacter sp.]
MILRLALIAMIALTGCGRPLSPGEAALAASLFGPELATQKIRIASFPALTSLTSSRPSRPPVACRERIWPEAEPTTGMVETFTAAFVSWNRINMADKLYLPDYLPQYPQKMSLYAAMLIGHEMTHVWQWQNRARTGYSPFKALNEHQAGQDPYLLELTAQAQFLDFPYEQQGAIVEEYVCCRALDPNGSRTKRLHAMLKGAFPVDPLDHLANRPKAVLPAGEVNTAGICD